MEKGLKEISNWPMTKFVRLVAAVGGIDAAEDLVRKYAGKSVENLFDEHACLVPTVPLRGNICNQSHDFRMLQPLIDYKERLNRLRKFFPRKTVFFSHEEFSQRSKVLIDELRSESSLSNILNGVYLPICLPKIKVNDYGGCLEKLLTWAGRSYHDFFKEREFNNFIHGDMVGNVDIIKGSRHEKLIEKMENGPVVGILFFPFQGFSLNAARSYLSLLPESFLLSGGIDITIGLMAYPDVLARDYKTPAYLFGANVWQSHESGLFFGETGEFFRFASTRSLIEPFEGCSAGLLYVG